jgi:hypothetical protein
LNTSAAKSNGSKNLMSVHFSALVVNVTTGDSSSFPCPRRRTKGSDKEEVVSAFGDDKLTAKVYPRINTLVATMTRPSINLLLLFVLGGAIV